MSEPEPIGAFALGLAASDLPLVWLVVGPDGRVTAANRFTAGLCGVDPVGRPFAELLVGSHQAARPGWILAGGAPRIHLSFAAPGRVPRSVVASVVAFDGGVLVAGAEDGSERLRVEAELGRVNGALAATTRDLQKANAALARYGVAQSRALDDAAERLLVSEGWLRRVVEGVGAGLWEWDPLDDRTVHSPEWLALHGLGEAPGTVEALERRLGPEAVAAFRAAARQVRAGAGPEIRSEYPVRDAGGGVRWVLSIGRLERRPDGRPARVLGIALDVTERKEVELALAASELRFRSIFLNSLDGVMLGSPDGAVLAANPAACVLLDRTEAEIRAAGRAQLVVQDAALEASLEERRRTGRTRAQLRVRRPDGTTCEVELASSVFELPGGGEVTVDLIKDVGPLRRSEAALQSLAGQLQASLEAERARIARDLHDDLGQALTGLQLDLRWLEERLEAQEATAQQGELLDRLVAASEVARSMVDAVQRISSDLRPGSLQQLGLIGALRQQLRLLARRTGLEVEADLDDAAELAGDTALAIYRISQEALTNVARHATARRVHLRLAAEAGAVCLEVSDDGCGLRPGREGPLRALGLLGMMERARALGGEVVVANGPGGGTVVKARLPLRPPPAGVPA